MFVKALNGECDALHVLLVSRARDKVERRRSCTHGGSLSIDGDRAEISSYERHILIYATRGVCCNLRPGTNLYARFPAAFSMVTSLRLADPLLIRIQLIKS